LEDKTNVFEAVNKRGYTPVHVAAMSPDASEMLSVLRLLLIQHCTITTTDPIAMAVVLPPIDV
jgi:ankyrin repeat protein